MLAHALPSPSTIYGESKVDLGNPALGCATPPTPTTQSKLDPLSNPTMAMVMTATSHRTVTHQTNHKGPTLDQMRRCYYILLRVLLRVPDAGVSVRAKRKLLDEAADETGAADYLTLFGCCRLQCLDAAAQITWHCLGAADYLVLSGCCRLLDIVWVLNSLQMKLKLHRRMQM